MKILTNVFAKGKYKKNRIGDVQLISPHIAGSVCFFGLVFKFWIYSLKMPFILYWEMFLLQNYIHSNKVTNLNKKNTVSLHLFYFH